MKAGGYYIAFIVKTAEEKDFGIIFDNMLE